MATGFWLVRHAIVAENERARLYGVLDVQLCPDSLVRQLPQYSALARTLPQPARWLCTPLSRTRLTAEAIFAAGYPAQDLHVVPGLIEQNLGRYQGLVHAALPPLLQAPAHPFWPLAGTERPPEGESMADVLVRVGASGAVTSCALATVCGSRQSYESKADDPAQNTPGAGSGGSEPSGASTASGASGTNAPTDPAGAIEAGDEGQSSGSRRPGRGRGRRRRTREI